MVEFKLPDVGEGMHEGEILKVLVKAGDPVQADQPLLEVQTDKVNAELTSPVAGVVREIRCREGEVVAVGTTLLVIDDGTDAAGPAGPTQVSGQPAFAPSPAAPAAGAQRVQRALATPYVRQLAREMKIDIERVPGTGHAGRVTEEDLRRFAAGLKGASQAAASQAEAPDRERASAAPAFASLPTGAAFAAFPAAPSSAASPNVREERMALAGIRKKIAEHMVKSVTIIPHVTSVDELEMDALRDLRERLKPHAEKRGVKLTYLPFFIKALVIALKEFPQFNASIDDETNEIVLKRYYNIGIATDTAQGLIVPVIKEADRKSIFQLAGEISELAQLARDGKLTREHITGGTFTISNVGPIGGLTATPIINHPEVAILALHKMEKRMVVRGDEGVIRWMMNMSLSFDHRLIDGVAAVRFTNRIRELLEDPNLLFAEMV